MKLKNIAKLPGQLLWAIVMEGVGTTRMAHVYARYGSGKLNITPEHLHPTPEELQEAGNQLKDIPRSLVFIAVLLMPIPGFVGGYALAAIAVEKWADHKIKVLPTRFRQVLESKEAA